jgi:RecB family exonuclease
LFALAASCVNNNFSFDSLKSLLLNDQIPWRRPDLNRALIEFGAEKNCVSGFWERGRFVDVWAEALARDGREELLGNYYGELKSRLQAMIRAKSFASLRGRYFAFRGWSWGPGEGEDPSSDPAAPGASGGGFGFLSREACSDEGDAALARCVEELAALIRLEEEYPELIPPSPFSFFLGELQELRYVPDRPNEPGVNIFPYRVAAGAPFGAHFVLGASQKSATVLYQPLKFLRQDKRRDLGLADFDASAEFFQLYQPGSFETAGGSFVSRGWISAAERTFSGWAIPHSRFQAIKPPQGVKPSQGDAYQAERDWWARGPGARGEDGFPPRLFRAQREGFERWRSLLGQGAGGYSFLRGPFPQEGGDLLARRLRDFQYAWPGDGAPEAGAEGEKLLKVSATDLNRFFSCPLSWLWGKVFFLKEETLEALLLDDASLGRLYHEILRNLFTRIREEDGLFRVERLETYRRWADEAAADAAERFPAFQGPLAVPLLRSLSWTIGRKIRALLDLEARYFPGFAVAELERFLELRRGDLLFRGILDRVSVSPDDEPFILDYKTGKAPTKADSTAREDGSLGDFQIPLYVKLYEETRGIKVGGALFISVQRRDLNAVLGKPGGKQGHRREAYEATLEALETYIETFAASIGGLNFVPPRISFEACGDCDYRGVCRTVYSLNRKEA